MIAPIVGMIFQPPAGRVLNDLPMGTTLTLQRQPDNQYDPDAIQVFLHGFGPKGPFAGLYHECLIDALPDDLPAGRYTWNLSALTDPLFLGYVSAKTGHAKRLANWLDTRETPTITAPLSLTLEGAPALSIEGLHDRDND